MGNADLSFETHLFLNRQFYPQPLTVRFSPNESRIDQPNFGQPFELPQANGQQFPRFQVTLSPHGRRGEVSIASPAP